MPKKKRKPGRPKLPRRKVRQVVLSFRVTPKEFRSIRGLGGPAYVRDLVLEDLEKREQGC